MKILQGPYRAFILFFTGLLLFLLVFRLLAKPKADAARAIPESAVITLSFKSFSWALAFADTCSDPVWKKIAGWLPGHLAEKDFKSAVKVLQPDAKTIQELVGRPLYLAYTANPADSMHALIAVESGSGFDLEQCIRNRTSQFKIFPYHYNGGRIYNLHPPEGGTLSVAQSQGLFLLSRYAYLVEEALSQLNRKNPTVSRPENTPSGATPLVVYSRPQNFLVHFEPELSPVWRKPVRRWLENVKSIEGVFRNGKLEWSIHPAASLGAFTPIAEAPAGGFCKVLPDNTAFFAVAGFRDKRLFFNTLCEEFDLDAFNEFVRPWAGHTACFALTSPNSPAMLNDEILILSVKDRKEAVKSLIRYGEKYGILKQYEYNTFEVVRWASGAAFQGLAPQPEVFATPCLAFIDDYVVITPDVNELELLIDHYIVNQTLVHREEYLRLIQQGRESEFQLFGASDILPSLLQQLFQPQVRTLQLPAVAGTGLWKVDIKTAPGRWSGNFSAYGASAPTKDAEIVWKKELPAPIKSRPFLLRSADQTQLLVVQDASNALHAFNIGGELLWSRQLTAPVLGEVHAVDFYRNGALCLLFNTADRIYTLDRRGNDLPGFPLPVLPAAANGLLAVQFHEREPYCYFLAKSDGHLYGYDYQGAPLTGWNPREFGAEVNAQAVHFQYKGKDYIGFLSPSGKFGLYNRYGKPHMTEIRLEGVFRGPLWVQKSGSPRMTAMNQNGIFWNISPDGKPFSLRLEEDRGSAPGSGLFAPFTGDGRWDYAYFGLNNLYGGAWSGDRFKTVFQQKMKESRIELIYPGEQRLGAYDPAAKKIWLFGADGRIQKGFPLAGNTPFILIAGRSTKENKILIAGLDNGLYAYKVP